MIRELRTATGMALAFGLIALASATAAGPTPAATRFAVAKVRFEQNATDGDVEVVFDITGRNDGLTRLTIVSPDGRTVADFTAPDGSTLGIRQFEFESPEPTDVAGLKAAYPEGEYTFTGTTAAGATLQGRATLSHQLPATTSFVHPQADAEGVPARDLEIAWSPTSDAVAYVIEIEEEGSDKSLKANLPQSGPRFAVPNGFLKPGAEYKLGIGTVSAEGNISFIETSFTTAATR